VQRWYISFHGGDRSLEWNNIHIYDLDGKPIGKALATDSFPNDLQLRELRGFAFGPDGDLYVANAYKDASQVLRFGGVPGGDDKHPFLGVYVEQHHANPGLDHPFDVVFGPDKHLYVPSQDTNVVGRYYGPQSTDGQAGHPMPFPPALSKGDLKKLLPGTFVPSEKHAPRGVRTVRRAIFGPEGNLYVADRDTDSIKKYDGKSGEYLREYRHRHLTKPVHLAFRSGDRVLLAGSRNSNAVFAIDTETGDVSLLIKPGMGGLEAPAGMAFGPDGKLYICSRETKQILRFDAKTGKPDSAPFIDSLEDYPEFISLVNI
jgi:DNA-binding beta-propeller fold protein YncE